MGNTKHVGTPPWKEQECKEHYLEKPLPSSEESERVCLGAVLLDNDIIVDLAAKLKPEDFYSPFNKRVYAAMLLLSDQLKPIDPILIGEELKKEGSIESMGGITSITNLTFGLQHFLEVNEYIEVILDKSRTRQGIRECNRIMGELLAEESSPYDVLETGSDNLSKIGDDETLVEFAMVADLVDGQIENAHHVQATGNPITGYATGFTELDVQLGGLQPADLIILAGRPSMGKTALGLGIANNGAFRHDKFVAVFSIEMGMLQLVNRAICSEAGVNGLNFRSGLLSHSDWDRINEAREFLKQGMLALDDSPTLCPAQMRHKLKRLIKQKGKKPDLIEVDYIQMMNANPGSKWQNRQEAMTLISRELKQIAKEMECPVIALSQLSRLPEGRAMNNHRPLLGDLRESGAIEQDADVVLFVYREEFYPKADGLVVGQGEAEIIIGKQRNGPTGTVKLYYDKESTRFGNYAAEF